MSLAFPQTVELHYKHVTTVIVYDFAVDEDLSKVTVTFRLQSDKTHAYRAYTTSYVASLAQLAEGQSALVSRAYDLTWMHNHDDMLAFAAAEAVKPRLDEEFEVPTY